ncbi:MAG TPA: lipid II flippase MurJ [Bryobacteraceae bacterium]|jgi:putative peptidoglycan lipid II flippase|nr:lipid II flippase MurJ [Bryobacteraceae bacterium]
MQRLFNRAVESPLVRGGLTLMIGVITGSALGVLRVALTAYLLGTRGRADSLAVALGPLDTFNSMLVNSMLFAFVPLLTARSGAQKLALFHKLSRAFALVFTVITLALLIASPWLMRILAPGLAEPYFTDSVQILRILSISTFFVAEASIYSALLFTDRRFAPTAFYQAALNVCTIVCALALWKAMGVYAFAFGYTLGSAAQLAIVFYATRRQRVEAEPAVCDLRLREVIAKPAFFAVYAAGLALNITFTRAWATHLGSGMAAALDYCMRGVGVPLALLVTPISNSLLPEIARLRSLNKMREVVRLVDRTLALTALAAIAGCAFALVFRRPAVALFFQRGNFTAESTRLVSAVFLGLGPCFVGWALLEITARSLFAINRHWPPVVAAAIPVVTNVAVTLRLSAGRPELLGVGATAGYAAGFLALFAMAHMHRRRWLSEQ